jgi:O-acetyl-ADP-ribose deacetylase (regulator of RNase III)
MPVEKLIDKAPEIIREAARSPLGLLALVVLLLSLLALIFFYDASEQIRLIIFVLILIAAAFFVAKVFQIAASATENKPVIKPSSPTPAVAETKAGRAGRKESKASVRLVAISRELLSTSSVDAVVVEEDTSLIMSAEARLKEVKESHERLIGQAQYDRPKAPGTVVVKDGSPLEFLAIVHDLESDPSWREDWVERALRNVLQEAEKRELRSIALPMLGTLHGTLTKRRFSKLLKSCLEQVPLTHLQTIWLMVPADTDRDVFEELGVFEVEMQL